MSLLVLYYWYVEIYQVRGGFTGILIDDHQIAILWNGPWHYREMPGLVHSLKQVQTRDRIKTAVLEREGWTVIVYEDRYYSPQTAFEHLQQIIGSGQRKSNRFPKPGL